MSNLQAISIMVDVAEDQTTAAESAAAAAVTGLTDAGLIVVSATFGGVSLLPSPADALRAALADLTELVKGKPSAAELAAAVTRVDDAAKVVEALVPTAPFGETYAVPMPADVAATLAQTVTASADEPTVDTATA